jgi:ZIP family zinc transporter
VIIMAVFLRVELSAEVVEQMLAAVAGIMTWITLHELLPSAFKHAGREGTIVAFFVGMALMSGNLWLLEHYVGDAH